MRSRINLLFYLFGRTLDFLLNIIFNSVEVLRRNRSEVVDRSVGLQRIHGLRRETLRNMRDISRSTCIWRQNLLGLTLYEFRLVNACGNLVLIDYFVLVVMLEVVI